MSRAHHLPVIRVWAGCRPASWSTGLSCWRQRTAGWLWMLSLVLGIASPLWATSLSAGSPPCDEVFPVVEWVVSGPCTDPPFSICLPASYSDLATRDLYLDGIPYAGPVAGCDFERTLGIPYSALPGAGAAGPYMLDSWEVDGLSYSGTFQTVADLVDSLSVWDPAGNWTLDAGAETIRGVGGADAYGDLVITQISSGIITVLGVNVSLTPLGARLELPAGSYWLIAEDPLQGCRDSLWMVVSCQFTSVLEVPMVVGQTDTLCLSGQELPGDLEAVFNSCPELSGDQVFLSWTGGNCFELTALGVGEGYACLVLCDSYGICDTTFVEILVSALDAWLPQAQGDTLFTYAGEAGQVNVLANDSLPGDYWKELYISQPPQQGTATLSPDGWVIFEPDPRFCGPDYVDSLVYVVCNGYGCASAAVYLEVECEPVVVYDGFSPNGDGVNDTFRVEGLEFFPQYRLSIYNRWGALVFESEQYENDWDGTWKGKDLPDGAYFYVLELGENRRLSGAVQLQR